MSWLNFTCVWLNGHWGWWRLWHWRTWRTNLAVKGVLIESITKTPEVGPPPTRQTLDLQGWITPKLETFCAFNAFLGFLLSSSFFLVRDLVLPFLFCRTAVGQLARPEARCPDISSPEDGFLLFTDVLSLTININHKYWWKVQISPFQNEPQWFKVWCGGWLMRRVVVLSS